MKYFVYKRHFTKKIFGQGLYSAANLYYNVRENARCANTPKPKEKETSQ